MAAPGLPALDNTMGALFLGVVLAMALWGAGTVQMYYYFNRYPKDNRYLKLLVVVVWMLDTIHQGLITHMCYTYLITEYANPPFLSSVVKSLAHMVIVSALICLLVQCFLVRRIWLLSDKNILMVSFLMVFVMGEFISISVFYGKCIKFKLLSELLKVENLSRAVNALAAASDILIAAALIFLLRRSRTGFKNTETLINRLIIFTINTGAMTSMCAIVSLIMITLYPSTFIYITPFLCVSKLYTNTLLASLNARKSMRGEMSVESEAENSMTMSRINPRSQQERESHTPGKILNEHVLHVRVDKETMRVGDQGEEKTAADSSVDVNHAQYYDTKQNYYVV